MVKNYGRSLKFLLAEKDIPDLHFDIKDKKEKGESSQQTEVMEIIDVTTGGMTPLNINFREHLRNLLENAAGEELQLVGEQRSQKQELDSELHSKVSEYREHSQKSRDNGKPTAAETAKKLVKRTLSRNTHPQHSECREHSRNSRIKQPGLEEATSNNKDAEPTATSSDFSKHSQNSLSNGEPKVDPGEAKVTFGDRDGQCLVTVSEFRELSPNSQVETEGSEDKQKKHHITPVCSGDSSKYSQDSLGVGNVSVPHFSWFKSMLQIVGLTATWQDKVEGNPTAAGTASNAKVNTNPVRTEFNFFLHVFENFL